MNQFSLITFNVNHENGAENVDKIIKILDIKPSGHLADTYFLQETTDEFVEELQDHFPKETYPCQIFRHPEKNSGDGDKNKDDKSNVLKNGGLAIVSKFPVRELLYVKLDEKRSKFHQQVVEIEVSPDVKIHVFHLHLRPSTNSERGFLKNMKDYFFTGDIRFREFSHVWALYNEMKKNEKDWEDIPVIFLGDFNEGSYGQTVKFVLDLKIDDKNSGKKKRRGAKKGAYCDAVKNRKTFQNSKGGMFTGFYQQSYDHVFFHTKKLKKKALSVINNRRGVWKITDHAPCFVQFYVLPK